MTSSEHCRRAIFQIYNVQNLKTTRITTFQVGSRWDPKCVFNFLRFFERTLYKSNYIIFILSWCGTHTKIMSKLVDIVTAGSQKITLWGPQRTPLGILRVKSDDMTKQTAVPYNGWRSLFLPARVILRSELNMFLCLIKPLKPSGYFMYRQAWHWTKTCNVRIT